MRDGDSLARAIVIVVFSWQMVGALAAFTRIARGFTRLLGYAVPAGFLLQYEATADAAVNVWGAIPGIAGLAAGVALFEWGRRSIRGKMFSYIMTDDQPEFVFNRGPFAWIRHPFYASYIISLCSAAAMFPSLRTWGIAAAMIAYFYAVTRFEEAKFARSPLAPQYEAYQRRTGRFLPRLR